MRSIFVNSTQYQTRGGFRIEVAFCVRGKAEHLGRSIRTSESERIIWLRKIGG